MPEGMKENDAFPEPIITPATKADEGHDEDISRDEIIAQGVSPKQSMFSWKITLESYLHMVQLKPKSRSIWWTPSTNSEMRMVRSL